MPNAEKCDEIEYRPKRMKKGDGPSEPSPYKVRETRVELARHRWHYLLRVARLPISPPALRMDCKDRHFLFEDNRAGKNFLANPISDDVNTAATFRL